MKAVAGTCCCPIALDHFDVGWFCPGRPITSHACTQYWEFIVLIGTRSSNQKDVSSFTNLSKKKTMEFQIKMITPMILQTCMLTANLRMEIFSLEFLSPSMKAVIGTCPCANSLDHLDFRLFIFGSHILSQDEFTVRLIQDGSSSSWFSRKLFKYANSLDHLDCSHGALAVLYIKFFISVDKWLSPSMKAVVRTCPCNISLRHLDFRLLMYRSHSPNQDEFTVSFILRQI